MTGPQQLPLRFPEAPLGFDTMAITAANRAVISAIRRPDRWSAPAFCLLGPEKSGLTTLAIAWAAENRGAYLDAEQASPADLASLQDMAGDYIAIDRADLIRDSAWLLQMHSAARRLGGAMLLTARNAPAQWGISKPDLLSRLRAAPGAILGPPDEALLRARLQRAAARTAITLPAKVEDYLVVRLGLSFHQVEETVIKLAGATGGKRALTIPLARSVLADFDDPGD